MTWALAEGHAPEDQCTEYFLLHYPLLSFHLVQSSKHKHGNLLLDKETRESKDLYKYMSKKVELKNKKTRRCLLMKEKIIHFCKRNFIF